MVRIHARERKSNQSPAGALCRDYMKMPLVHGYELMLSNTMHVSFWQQPVHRWLIAAIYHWYDMRVFRLWGFKKLEKWLQHRHNDEFYIPLSAQQDLRCYHLTQKGRITLATVEITNETYAQLRHRWRRDD